MIIGGATIPRMQLGGINLYYVEEYVNFNSEVRLSQ